jgi:hypothetical protein
MFIFLSVVSLGLSEGVRLSGPPRPPEFTKALEQFNADVAAWNKRCKITQTEAEDAWCKKERARIDARRKELVASGAIPR